MRTTENPVKTTNGLILSAAAIASGLALAACGGSGANPSSPSPAPAHAAVTAASGDTRLRSPPRPAGSVITARTSEYGRILVDRGDHTIYLFTRDRTAASTCYGACAAAWPPVLTAGAPGGAGRLRGALGTTRRRDGARQVTYDGHPLYYYRGDVSPGQILCQNVDEFGGTWLVVSPSGKPVR
jgi:predicted lipoprotein with Yx(FWY)xxD motif